MMHGRKNIKLLQVISLFGLRTDFAEEKSWEKQRQEWIIAFKLRPLFSKDAN